jgi:hypothetical protein
MGDEAQSVQLFSDPNEMSSRPVSSEQDELGPHSRCATHLSTS